MAQSLFIENPDRLVYKAAQYHIVTLRIVKGSLTNLERKVINIECAKYKCQTALVVKIEDQKGRQVTSINSDYDSKFIYKVGTIVKVDDYDQKNTCSAGIHFFLSRERAFFYILWQIVNHWSHEQLYLPANFVYPSIDYTGNAVDYDEDGRVIATGSFVNGKYNGEYVMWENGKKRQEKNYRMGLLHGKWIMRHKNGEFSYEKTYVNGAFRK